VDEPKLTAEVIDADAVIGAAIERECRIAEHGSVLPDSRTRARHGQQFRAGAWWVPVYCASCGKFYGHVPEEGCTFACWLCDPCSTKYGALASTYFMPEELFWARLRAEQIAKYRRLLTPAEITRLVATDPDNPIAKLLTEGAPSGSPTA